MPEILLEVLEDAFLVFRTARSRSLTQPGAFQPIQDAAAAERGALEEMIEGHAGRPDEGDRATRWVGTTVVDPPATKSSAPIEGLGGRPERQDSGMGHPWFRPCRRQVTTVAL